MVKLSSRHIAQVRLLSGLDDQSGARSEERRLLRVRGGRRRGQRQRRRQRRRRQWRRQRRRHWRRVRLVRRHQVRLLRRRIASRQRTLPGGLRTGRKSVQDDVSLRIGFVDADLLLVPRWFGRGRNETNGRPQLVRDERLWLLSGRPDGGCFGRRRRLRPALPAYRVRMLRG